LNLAGKLAASIADQGVASSTNFVLNILLARWLLTRDYGAFSVCWSVLLLLAAFHNALILEPMTVVGPAQFHDRLQAYFRANSRLNWLVVLALVLCSLLFALIYKDAAKDAVVRSSSIAMAAALPGYFLLLTARRKQYVLNRPVRALQLSLIYSVLVFGFIYACRATGQLSGVLGVAALGMAWFIVPFVGAKPGSDSIPLKEIAREHWHYGKWLFASALLAIGASDMQTLLLFMLVDLKSAGALRALMNFVLPLSQLLTVLSVYALPRLSSRAQTWGAHKLLTHGILFPVAMLALITVYLGALLVLAPFWEHLLYRGKMHVYLDLVPLLAASAFAAGIGASFSALLRAVRNSQHIFISGVVGSAVGIGFAFLLQRHLGIAGALFSLLAANISSTLIIVATYLVLLRRSHA
jgi:O-antigen/teichoic acid export membrane protein